MHLKETETKTQQEAGRQPPRTPAAPPVLRSRAHEGFNLFQVTPKTGDHDEQSEEYPPTGMIIRPPVAKD
jgi:hypothetical protein